MVASEFSGVNDQKSLERWVSQMPELKILADIKPVFVFGKNSANITPEVWTALAQQIQKRAKNHAGFVVFHGADNIEYTSSSLSFLLQGIRAPVVFTGHQNFKDQNDEQGLRSNLINAVQVATFPFAEVALLFGSRLLRANQAVRVDDESLNLFTAPPSAILGRIDFSIRLFEKNLWRSKIKPGKPKPIEPEHALGLLKVGPLLGKAELQQSFEGKAAVILAAQQAHELPDTLERFLRQTDEHLPVVVHSRYIQPGTLTPENIIVVSNMTWPAAVTKLIWVLGQTRSVRQVRELMHKNLAGEIQTD